MAASAIPSISSGESNAGNPAGSIKGTPTSAIDKMLEAAGIPVKGAPFMAFYFIIMTVVMGQQNKAEQKNMSKFSGQLNDMSNTSKLWAQVRQAFMGGYQGLTDGAMPTDPSADGSDSASRAFRTALANFINKIAQSYNAHLPPPNGSTYYGPVHLNNDGGKFSPYLTPNMQLFFSWINLQAQTPAGLAKLDKTFPTFGRNITQIISAVQPLSNFCEKNVSLWSQTWKSTWETLSVGGQSTVIQNPQNIQTDFDKLSNVEGIVNGVSATESSKLQYAQNQYNRLISFAKDMLNAWCSMRKAANMKMGQANS